MTARRGAATVPALTARAAALAEVAVRVEHYQGPGAAHPVWQQAMVAAISSTDALARAMGGRAVAQRRLKIPSEAKKAQTYLKEVYQAAVGIQPYGDRALALREIARTMATYDKSLAAEAVEGSAEAARKIPEPLVRSSALSAAALAAASFDPKLAKSLIGDAEKAWQVAAPGQEREFAATEIARAWAAVDWQEAVALASGLSDQQARAQALEAAAEELARRDPDKALVAVQKCDNPELRAISLAAVAVRLTGTRPDLAALLAGDAMKASAKSPQSLRDLVAKSAAPALAPTDPDQAIKVAAGIKDPDTRAEATVAVASVLAPKDPERALKLVTDLNRPELSEPAMPEILYSLAKKDPAKAFSEANHILERYLRVLAMLRIWDAMTAKAASPSPGGH